MPRRADAPAVAAQRSEHTTRIATDPDAHLSVSSPIDDPDARLPVSSPIDDPDARLSVSSPIDNPIAASHLTTADSPNGAFGVRQVFFASDNGAHNEGGHNVHFFNSTGGLRGFKRSYYEGGIRSPSIVRWPGVTSAGSRSATPWAFWCAAPSGSSGRRSRRGMYT